MPSMIDISVPLREGMPLWPGSEPFQLKRTMCMDNGEEANVSALHTDVHAGTHIDSPWHMLNRGLTVDQFPLEKLIGEAFVVHLPDILEIQPADLERAGIPDDVHRLLLKTRNSRFWEEHAGQFKPDYTALNPEAARWIVKRGICTVGIDYFSVQPYRGLKGTHQILMESEIVIIEGLDLSGVEQGRYELFCLPIKLVGCDGAPARAVLRTLE